MKDVHLQHGIPTVKLLVPCHGSLVVGEGLDNSYVIQNPLVVHKSRPRPHRSAPTAQDSARGSRSTAWGLSYSHSLIGTSCHRYADTNRERCRVFSVTTIPETS